MALRNARAREPLEPVGQRLARLRKARGLSQVELARQLGVPQSYVSRYERGKLRLHAELIIQGAGVLGTTADELLGLVPAKGETLRSRRLIRRLRNFDRLSRRNRETLLHIIDTFLRGAGVEVGNGTHSGNGGSGS